MKDVDLGNLDIVGKICMKFVFFFLGLTGYCLTIIPPVYNWI